MIARRTVLFSASVVAVIGLAACHRKEDAAAADPQAVAAAQSAIASPAWLRQHLPAQTVSYLRIPSPWGMLGGVPNGRPLDAALSTKAHLDAIAKIRAGVASDKVLADLKATPALTLLLADLRSPVEVALVDPLGIPSPTSRVVITALLDFPTVAAFNERVAALGGSTPLLAAPLDAQGYGTLASGGAIRYAAAEHRLWVTQSMQEPSDNAKLDELVKTFAASSVQTAPATLTALEARIDTSGEGLFGWATVRGIGGVAAAQVGDSPLGKLPSDFAAKTDAVAFGGGTVDGHGTFQMVVHAPQARALQYIAPQSFDVALKSVGEPRWAMTMALPTAASYKQFEDNLNLDFGAEKAKAIRDGIAKLKARYGAEPADYVRWFGPEFVVFADNAGMFFAMRTADRKDWYARINAMKDNGWTSGVTTVAGTQVHWLTMPADAGQDLPPDADPSLKSLMTVMSRMGNRSYWVEDGDWVVMARVPQALADRAAASPDTSLSDWFKARAYPGKHTLLGFTATTRDAQRDAYYTYIEILQAIGGIAGADVDIAALPAAHTLGLPDKGVIGAAVEADTDTLALSFTYEQSPVELAGSSGSLVAVGVLGIAAGIAVPAYKDYTVRSQVSTALAAADQVKAAVAERRLSTGKFPTTNKAAGLDTGGSLGNDYAGSVAVGQGGEIVVTLDGQAPHKADAALDGAQLVLLPKVDGGQVTWTCSAEGIDTKYLPPTCQDEAPDL